MSKISKLDQMKKDCEEGGNQMDSHYDYLEKKNVKHRSQLLELMDCFFIQDAVKTFIRDELPDFNDFEMAVDYYQELEVKSEEMVKYYKSKIKDN